MRLWILAAVVAGGVGWGWGQQTEKPAEKAPEVVFSGQPAAVADQKAAGPAAAVTDAERLAVAITAWDLDLHLSPRTQSVEAHARVTLRNAGEAPLGKIALDLSSTLHFEVVGWRGKKVAFAQGMVASDADHTGSLQEAVIPLEEALRPGAAMTLDVDYGGTLALSAQRLTAIGAPDATAQGSDWDRVGADFIGVRGFGNVVWYPVSSVPVKLGDGAQLFSEIGRQKAMDEDATASVRVTDEFFGQAPNAVILDGHFVGPVQPTTMPSAAFPGVMTVVLPATRLGFETPSFFVARRTEVDGHGLRVLATDADAGSAQRYVESAGLVEPLVRMWLGEKPRSVATILDLPEPDDAAAETGALLTMPLSSDDAAHLSPVVVHALAHGGFWVAAAVAGGRRGGVYGIALAGCEPGTAGNGGESECGPAGIGSGGAQLHRAKGRARICCTRRVRCTTAPRRNTCCGCCTTLPATSRWRARSRLTIRRRTRRRSISKSCWSRPVGRICGGFSMTGFTTTTGCRIYRLRRCTRAVKRGRRCWWRWRLPTMGMLPRRFR